MTTQTKATDRKFAPVQLTEQQAQAAIEAIESWEHLVDKRNRGERVDWTEEKRRLDLLRADADAAREALMVHFGSRFNAPEGLLPEDAEEPTRSNRRDTVSWVSGEHVRCVHGGRFKAGDVLIVKGPQGLTTEKLLVIDLIDHHGMRVGYGYGGTRRGGIAIGYEVASVGNVFRAGGVA